MAAAALALPAAAQALPQTWVTGTGDDANPCTRDNPCRTFPGAISKTDAGGTITAASPGAFGTVTITKSITIDATGAFGGVVAAGTSAVTVNAGATGDVVLRGLTLEYKAPCTATGAQHGVRLITARSLRIEDATIQGFPGAAVDAEPTADGASVSVSGSKLNDNCTAALLTRRASASGVTASLTGSFLSANATGVLAGTGSHVSISGDTIVGNGTGLATETGGALGSYGDNHLAGNVLDGAPTADLAPPVADVPPSAITTTTTVPGPTVTVTGPSPAPAPAVPVAPVARARAVIHCRVPNLAAMTLTRVRRALPAARCAVGAVRYRVRRSHRPNRVYAQTTRAGTTRVDGARIGVTINAPKAVKGPPVPATAKAAVAIGPSRTWVSGVGSDADSCSRTAPCLTFAGALAKTIDGGTIDALDAGDFGPVTIDAPVTIDGAGQAATITAAPGASAITIAAPAGSAVTLRGLTLRNPGGCTVAGPGDGVQATSGGVLHLEDITASGFAGAGVSLEPTGALAATLQDVQVSDGCTAGIAAQPAGAQLDATVDGARLDHDGTGVLAADGALVRLAASSITDNATALSTTGDGVLQSWDDNRLAVNAAPGATPTPLALG